MTKTTTTTRAPATAAQASLYQQLRSHLGVLKLAACAEALPTVLDQAVTEKLTLTAALERLLAIEVNATEARRLAGRLRFACLPTPATLEDYDYDAQPGVDRALINELGTCGFLESATNVLLIGPTNSAAIADRGRRRVVPSCVAEISQDERRAHQQQRRRGVGRHPRRHHRRRRHARPAPAPLRRAQPRRRQLPTPRPPRPHRHTPPNHHRHSPTTTLNPPHRWGVSMSTPGEFR